MHSESEVRQLGYTFMYFRRFQGFPDALYQRPLSSFPRNNHGKVVVSWSCRNLVAFTTGFRKTPNNNGRSSHPKYIIIIIIIHHQHRHHYHTSSFWRNAMLQSQTSPSCWVSISTESAPWFWLGIELDYRPQLSNGIHVVDPDCPWEVCSFHSAHEDPIDQLLWDGTGSRLLSIDTAGLCKVWAMRVSNAPEQYSIKICMTTVHAFDIFHPLFLGTLDQWLGMCTHSWCWRGRKTGCCELDWHRSKGRFTK